KRRKEGEGKGKRREEEGKEGEEKELSEKGGGICKVYSPGEASGLSSNVSEQNQGIILWKYFLLAALIFLLLESILLRWWK
ncbi:MAG: hypothetical protein ACKOZZ_03585, partial [Bacteroidota bacterium]